MSRKLVTTLFASFALAYMLTTQAQATAVNVQVGSTSSTLFVGTAAAPDAGTTWNLHTLAVGANVASFSSGALLDSTGGASGVTYSASSSDGGFNGYDLVANGLQVSDYTNSGTILPNGQHYLAGNEHGTITISGLSALNTYALYIYSDRGGSGATPAPNTTSFTVTSLAGPSSATSGVNSSATSGFNTPEDYLLFSSLSPTGGNQLIIDFTAVDAFGALNGFQLVATPLPEPSAFALLLGGCFAMARWVRRRSQ